MPRGCFETQPCCCALNCPSSFPLPQVLTTACDAVAPYRQPLPQQVRVKFMRMLLRSQCKLPMSICNYSSLVSLCCLRLLSAVCEPGTPPEVICADPTHPCNKQYGDVCSLDQHNVCCPYLGNSALECGDNLCVPYCDPCYPGASCTTCNYEPCPFFPADGACNASTAPPTPPSPQTVRLFVIIRQGCVWRLSLPPVVQAYFES